jgi:hypothetical protein
LSFPTTHIDFYAQRIFRNGPFTNYAIRPTDLVYVCGVESRAPCQVGASGRRTVAAASSGTGLRPVPPFGATILMLCPTFFQSPPYGPTAQGWLSNPQIFLEDGSSTLLHEAQHMGQLTGEDRRCDDIKTLQEPTGCYTIQG